MIDQNFEHLWHFIKISQKLTFANFVEIDKYLPTEVNPSDKEILSSYTNVNASAHSEAEADTN